MSDWRDSVREYLRRHPVQKRAARGICRAVGKAGRLVRPAPDGRDVPEAEPPELHVRDESVPVIAVVPESWFGVTTSTLNNFPNVLFCDRCDPSGAADALLERGPRTVVFSGMPGVSERMVRELRRRASGVRLAVHYHGSLVQCAQPEIRERFGRTIALAREGAVDAVGCAKAGMAEALQSLGVEATYVPYRVAPPDTVGNRPADSPRKVGVFVRDIFRKSAHTQFMAAAMVEDAEIHCNELPDLSYLPRPFEAVEHGELPYEEFLELLGSMDVNFYVSLSECYPMVVVESLIRGVPCLTSHSHEILAHDADLADRLIVPAYDDPTAIAAQAERVLADREPLGRRCAEYALELNRRAEAAINEFVDVQLYESVR